MTNEYTPQWESEYVCVIVYAYRDREKERERPIKESEKKKELGKRVDILRETQKDTQDDMEAISALVAFCDMNPPVTGDSLHKGSAIRTFQVFFVISLNKQLSYQWFEMRRRSGDATVTKQ